MLWLIMLNGGGENIFPDCNLRYDDFCRCRRSL